MGAAHGYAHPDLGPLGAGDFTGLAPYSPALREAPYQAVDRDAHVRFRG